MTSGHGTRRGSVRRPGPLAFASKHAGETDELLTAHHTGNFGVAGDGGEDGQFARACPGAHEAVVSALQRHAPPDYEVGMECTHHGPTESVSRRCSSRSAVRSTVGGPRRRRGRCQSDTGPRRRPADRPRENGTRRHLLGVGGGHYAPRFERSRARDGLGGRTHRRRVVLDAMAEWADSDEERDTVLDRAFRASAADYALIEGDRPDLTAAIESRATASSVRRSFRKQPVSTLASSRR